MNNRDFLTLKRRCVRAYARGDKSYTNLMDQAVAECSEEQWEQIKAAIDRVPEEEGGSPPQEERDLPHWRDGEPANLTAASASALLWLHHYQDSDPPLGRTNRERLAACITALERELEKGEE